AADDAALRTSKQLVAAVGDDVDAGAQAIEHSGLAMNPDGGQIKQGTAAEVFHQGKLVLARDGDQLFDTGLLGEARDFEIGTMNAQQQASFIGDSALIVGGAGAVGGANFAQHGA